MSSHALPPPDATLVLTCSRFVEGLGCLGEWNPRPLAAWLSPLVPATSYGAGSCALLYSWYSFWMASE